MQLTVNPGFTALSVPKLFVSLFSDHVASRLRRTIFVFSVLAVIDKEKGTNKDIVSEINFRLKLAHNCSMCHAIGHVYDKIWGHTTAAIGTYNNLSVLKTAWSQSERELIATYYVRHCPDWLRYGTPDGSDMSRDLSRLFTALLVRDA